MLLHCFIDQDNLSDGDIIEAEDGESALAQLIQLQQDNDGTKIKEYSLEYEMDSNMAAKFGQKPVSSNQVSLKCSGKIESEGYNLKLSSTLTLEICC